MAAGRAIDTAEFRRAVGRFATGVTVVSTVHESVRYGLTVNSLTSVSLDPLLVLFCCELDAHMYVPLIDSGVWGVSVLSTAQQAQSQWFAKRGTLGTDQFVDQSCHAGAETGVPLLDGSLATFECRTYATYDGGDHTIVVGQVVNLTEGPAGRPLIYFSSGYRTVGD